MKLFSIIQELILPRTYHDELQAHREQLVFNILRAMSVLGFILLAVYAVLAFREQRWLTLITFTAIYLWTFSITFIRRLPFPVRTVGLLLIIYCLGLITMLQDGLQGNGRVYLLAFSVIAGVLLGAKTGIFAITASGLTLIAAHVVFRSGLIDLPHAGLSDPSNIPFWAVALTAYVTVAVTTTVSVVTLLRRVEKSLKLEKTFSTTLENEQKNLEENIRQRTKALERRLLQLHTVAEITRTITALLDPEELLQQVVGLIRERFDLYYAGVFLLDKDGQFAVLTTGTGEAGSRMVSEGHKLAVGGGSMIGWATANKKARIALDVGKDAVRFSNPQLPLTRSELALPLIVGERVLGALTIQSAMPEAFDQDDITILQGMADGLATALENAHLYQQASASLREIQHLHQQYLEKAWGQGTLAENELSFTFANRNLIPAEKTNTIEVPVILRDNVIGLLALEGEKSTLSPEELLYVETLASEAAAALENVRLLRETQQRAERERLVSEIAAKVRGSSDVEAVIQTTLMEVGRALRASTGYFVLHTSDGQSSTGKETRKSDHSQEMV
jgi:GAF domain-containing protein